MSGEDLLQKHSQLEDDINLLGERVKQVKVQHSQRFLGGKAAVDYRPCDLSIIMESVQDLEDGYAELVKFVVERR